MARKTPAKNAPCCKHHLAIGKEGKPFTAIHGCGADLNKTGFAIKNMDGKDYLFCPECWLEPEVDTYPHLTHKELPGWHAGVADSIAAIRNQRVSGYMDQAMGLAINILEDMLLSNPEKEESP